MANSFPKKLCYAMFFRCRLYGDLVNYVTGWRMQHAYDEFISNGKSVMQITEDCGYQSETAFRKAFKK